MLDWSGSALRISALMVVVLVVASATFAIATGPRPIMSLQAEIALQPCFSEENDCRSPDVWTSDGRVLVEVVPFYAGTAHVYLEGLEPLPTYLYTCTAPQSATSCSMTVETSRPGTYAINVVFDGEARGALLLEVLTPS